MLVLSRKTNEELWITRGDATILVTVLQLSGGRVKLGIVAPPDISIRRAENGGSRSRVTSEAALETSEVDDVGYVKVTHVES